MNKVSKISWKKKSLNYKLKALKQLALDSSRVPAPVERISGDDFSHPPENTQVLN